jgi:glycosyltransferase involved in cell wall biosynthesis
VSPAAPKLLFFVAEDWYFCSHRLHLAEAAQKAGLEVAVVTRVRRHGDLIRQRGIRVIPIELSRRGLNPLRDLVLIARMTAIYRRERPDLVHQVAMKPVLYGSLAACLTGVPGVVNALAGLGFLFSSAQLQARLLRPLVLLALRALLDGAGTRVIVQNPDDLALLNEMAHLDSGRMHLIPGAGVDLERFRPAPEPPGPPVVMLPARLLWDKGVGEFVAAARLLRARGSAARWVLVGAPDPGNPAAVAEGQIRGWVEEGLLEWWGRRENMPATLAQSHIVCLPTSYGEGLPKVLAEAAACARPIVTTDAPGCREVVRHGKTGLLVPVRDPSALAAAVERLLGDTALRARYGAAGRRLAEAGLGTGPVAEATLAVYRSLLPLQAAGRVDR